MRNSLRGAIGLAAVGLLALAATPSFAQKAERRLLGINMWNRWSDVLKKHGQPTRIEVGAVTTSGEAGAPGAMGGGMAGGPMMGPPMGGGPMNMGAMMGGGTYGGGSPYGGMMSAMMGGGRRMGGPGGLPGMPGMGPYGGRGPGMTPGGEGGGGEMSPGGAPMGPGMGPGMMGGEGSGSTETTEGEITWVYERGPLTNNFLFNKDGRVIQIQSFGYKGGSAVTDRGVRLGDTVGKIYAKYGWTGQMSKDGQRNTMTLDYSKDYHCAFQLADLKDGKGYRVVGITVAITEKNNLGGGMQGMSFGAPGGMMGGPMMGGPSMGMPSMGGPSLGGPVGGGPRRGGGKFGGGGSSVDK